MSYAQAVVVNGSLVSLRLAATTDTTVAEATATNETGTEVAVPEDPSPLKVEKKELIPGLASFLVLLVLLRYVFYPKVHGAMTARTEHVRQTLVEADSIRDVAHAEVAEYRADLAKVQDEAIARIEAARQTVESERTAKMAAVNTRLAVRRADATAAADAAKAAASSQVASAAGDVAGHLAGKVLGKTPDAGLVQQAVATVMGGVK
jgi:F0F1-type ATP synthase membrane subunit b/b'